MNLNELSGIFNIEYPTTNKFNEMTIEELEELKNELEPFYQVKVKILDEFGYGQFYKARSYETVSLMIDNIKSKKDRWDKITSNFKQ